MRAEALKPETKKRQSVVNSASKAGKNGQFPFQFVDSRPETIAQRKLQAIANAHVDHYNFRPKGNDSENSSSRATQLKLDSNKVLPGGITGNAPIQLLTLPAKEYKRPPKKKWTKKQREQSEKFWKKKHEKQFSKEKAEDDILTARQRNSLVEITGADERFFERYMHLPKRTLKVYRGDGRGVNAHSLDNLRFQNILPGGTRDVSFYGVVEHTHTSSAKNGMVSTTSAYPIAHGFATDDHKYGIVYEMLVKDYIDVGYLLRSRNFRNRFAAQREILVPHAIKASQIKSATLYQDGRAIKTKKNGG